MKAIVVAHPDDESLWCAGLPITEPGDWTIICCSIPRIDPIRAWKFHDACAVLGAISRLIPIPETSPTEPLTSLHWLDLSGYDEIYTHGEAGEYGHLHHCQLFEHVTRHWAYKPIFTFWGRDRSIELTPDQWRRKRAALKCYDHVLPYGGRNIPKWQALLERYGHTDLKTETYARYKP